MHSVRLKRSTLIPVLGIALLSILLSVCIVAPETALALSLKQGSSGAEVKALQQELKHQGFYSGTVDGVYGAKTTQAVKNMQTRYGLTADGVAGPATLAALGLDGSSNTAATDNSNSAANNDTAATSGGDAASALSNDDITLLARAIHAEAEGEPYIGKVAVGAVLINRVNHRDFPNTLSGVVYQSLALESVSNGRMNNDKGEDSIRAAQDAAAGWDPTYGCLYFWNPQTATSTWIWTREISVTYGNHVFGR